MECVAEGRLRRRRWRAARRRGPGAHPAQWRRWETSGGSIFSVADGRRLAQEPVRLPTAFEAARQRKIERAVTETPLVRPLRLCPQRVPVQGTDIALVVLNTEAAAGASLACSHAAVSSCVCG